MPFARPRKGRQSAVNNFHFCSLDRRVAQKAPRDDNQDNTMYLIDCSEISMFYAKYVLSKFFRLFDACPVEADLY